MLIQIDTNPSAKTPRKLFYSYAHEDEEIRDRIDVQLTELKRDGLILDWHDRKIHAGEDWGQAISQNLEAADIILFLVSPSFLTSAYCRDIEVKRAMERQSKGEAVVVPIIIRPCQWTSEDFAKLEALPKTGKPLSEWLDPGLKAITDGLRVLILEMKYPRLPNHKTDGLHGHWILKIKADEGSLTSTDTETIVQTLRDITGDYSIRNDAFGQSQVVQGARSSVDTILILSGTADAFAVIQGKVKCGELSKIIKRTVVSFYIGYGSTVQNKSQPIVDDVIKFIETCDLTVDDGGAFEPSLLKGLRLNDSEPRQMHFIVGIEEGTSPKKFRESYRNQIDYFKAALSVKEENFWVNLSAYESDRMIPKPLSGTRFGRDLLAQDVVLKRLTASLMHPDTPSGRRYWSEAFAYAKRRYGSDRVELASFQKVWIIPKRAVVYEMPFGEEPPKELSRFGVVRGDRFAYVAETELVALSECDLVAKQHPENLKYKPEDEGLSEFLAAHFGATILPIINEKINSSKIFGELRQIYNALIIATCFKKKLRHVEAFRRLFDSIDNDNPAGISAEITGVESLSGTAADINDIKIPFEVIDEKRMDSPFEIPENAEFYGEYVKLFRSGVFKCARNDKDLYGGDDQIRMYFSGSIDLRDCLTRLSG